MYQVKWNRILIVALVVMSPWLLSGMSHLLGELDLFHGINSWIADSFYHPRAFKGFLIWGVFLTALLLAIKVWREHQ